MRASHRLALTVVFAVPAAIFLAVYSAVDRLPLGKTATINLMAAGFATYLGIAIFFYRKSLTHYLGMQQAALTDTLCGLPNRRALHRDVTQNARQGDEVAIALLNLDGFKSINDFYGHSVGDRVIKEVAAILRSLCANNGQAYRLGGDEFAVAIVGPQAGNIVEGICRRLLQRMIEPVMIEDRSISTGASIGLARSEAGEGSPSSELLRQADIAMSASKMRGKGRVTWFSGEFDQNRVHSQQIDTELRTALAEGHLRLHYQPLIDTKTGRVSAVEALIRWERPDGKRIGPDTFIPIAEETGLIEAIGLWVLRQACSDARGWDGIKLSVNVSVAQLRNSQFPLQLGHILDETGFPPARLELEITETFLVGDPVVAGRNLEMLRDFGVGIVLDDYGTGYASIGFLRRFRFQKLKLDRSLIVDAASDAATRTVMASSVTMAKALGMKVTAEGIETEVHASLARTAGCDQMQGWLYSKAIPADEITRQLEDEAGEQARSANRRRANG